MDKAMKEKWLNHLSNNSGIKMSEECKDSVVKALDAVNYTLGFEDWNQIPLLKTWVGEAKVTLETIKKMTVDQ